MLSFTTAQLDAWLGQFIWPFFRLAGLISTAPLFSESSIPTLAKLGLAFALTVLVSASLGPMPSLSLNSYEGLWLLTQQVMIGMAIGLVMRTVFSAVQTAGEFIGMPMGLSLASVFDPLTGANTAVLARLINIMAMLMFLAIDGHLLLLAALARSFEALPVAVGALDPDGWLLVARWAGTIFSTGLLLALPLICALLTTNLAMGILNRSAPQLTVFAIGFPLSLLGGLMLLSVVLPQSGSFFENQFQQGFDTIAALLDRLAGR
jgi:flagellar biosynthetic protein FliR